MPKKLRDFVIAVSLSNLCFVWAWQVLANPGHYSYYYLKHPRGATEVAALMLDVLLLAAVFWGLMYFARRSKSRLPLVAARWIFLLVLAVPVYSVLHQRDADAYGFGFDLPGWIGVLVALGAVALIFMTYRWQRQVFKVAVAGVLILAPMVVINFGYSLWLEKKHGPPAGSLDDKKPVSPPSPRADSQQHVIWIIFDELDQRLAFDQRPESLNLPEFDRLSNEAVYAQHALPPTGQTLSAMPALITGRIVLSAIPRAPDNLQLTLENQTSAAWGGFPNIFSTARGEGFTTALVGWYHPYCRVIGASLDFCAWEPFTARAEPDSKLPELLDEMLFWGRESFYRMPTVVPVGRESRDKALRKDHITAYSRILEHAQKLGGDPTWNLVLIHFPIPHGPWIFDSKTKQLSSAKGHSYEDNLALADNALGELRRSFEAKGMWDSSTVLVSSDHWWREGPKSNGKRDHRVPFLLKLPRQWQGTIYEKPIDTLLTKDILLMILRGEISKPESLVQWLDQHPSSGESAATRALP